MFFKPDPCIDHCARVPSPGSCPESSSPSCWPTLWRRSSWGRPQNRKDEKLNGNSIRTLIPPTTWLEILPIFFALNFWSFFDERKMRETSPDSTSLSFLTACPGGAAWRTSQTRWWCPPWPGSPPLLSWGVGSGRWDGYWNIVNFRNISQQVEQRETPRENSHTQLWYSGCRGTLRSPLNSVSVASVSLGAASQSRIYSPIYTYVNLCALFKW